MTITFNQELSFALIFITLYVFPAVVEIRRDLARWIVGERPTAFSLWSICPVVNLLSVGFGTLNYQITTCYKLDELRSKTNPK